LIFIGIIASQTILPIFPNIPNEEKMKKDLMKNVNDVMCKGEYPKLISVAVKLIPQQFLDAKYFAIVFIASLALVFLFNLLPQNNFFMWAFVRFFTIVFFAVVVASGVMFAYTPSEPCKAVKKFITSESVGFAPVVQLFQNNTYVEKALKVIPSNFKAAVKTYYPILIDRVNKLGVTAPIFVIVIALYLIIKETRNVTKYQILSLVSLIVALISGIEYYKVSHSLVFSIVLPLITIVVVMFAVNCLLLNFGYLFVAPVYFYSCYALSYRLFAILIAFHVPFDLLICAVFFSLLFLNVFFWSNGMYLTVVFLLYYGLSILYTLPIDSLVVLLFVLTLFACECPCCCKAACKKEEEKQKTD